MTLEKIHKLKKINKNTKNKNIGMVSHVISTNVDGLHRRSGLITKDELSELHGNVYLEKCNLCQGKPALLFQF